MDKRVVRVWDLPTRVFHWALVLLVAMAWLSGEVLDNFAIHEWVGLSLAVLLGMVLTGIFANNDGDYAGPLAFLVSSGVSGVLTSIHKALFNLLVLLVVVHVGAEWRVA